MSKKNGTVKTVSYIFIITLLGKLLALVRDSMLGRQYGIGMETSAFFTASRIPRVLFDAIFASAITSSFIPIFNKCLKKEGKDTAYEFSDIFISCVSVFMFILMFVCMIFAKEIAVFFADGFDQPTLDLCVKLLRILFPTMICTGIAFSFVGILQSMDIFLIPASISVIFNVIIIGYYFTFNKIFGIYGLAFTYLLGWIMQVMVQVPALKRVEYRWHFKPNFAYPYFKETLILMIPVMVSTWVQPFNIMINAKYASRLYGGDAVSAIEFANNLYTMIVGVLVISIMNYVFPKLSKLAQENKEDVFNETVNATILSTMLFVVPLTVGVMSLSQEIIGFIYGGNKFDAFAIEITAQALFYFSLGMVGYSLQTILSRVYFAKENGKIPMSSAIIAIVVNYVFCNVFIEKYGIKGLAVAASISVSVNALMLIIPLQLSTHKIINKPFIIEMTKILLASFFMYLVIVFVKRILPTTVDMGTFKKLINLLIVFIFGVASYFLSAIVLKMEQMKMVKNMVKNR